MVLLEKEIYLRDFDFTNSDQYVDYMYASINSEESGLGAEKSDLNTDLLLGNQGWRYGFFFP